MAEITIGTDDGKVSIRVLVTDKDISIFLADNCDIIGIGGLDPDKDGFQIYEAKEAKSTYIKYGPDCAEPPEVLAVAKADDDDDIVRTTFGKIG